MAKATAPGHLGGHLPDSFPMGCYLRDKPALPPDAEVLAIDEAGEALVFSTRGNCLGFLGHPGMKRGMMEDLIMEFTDTPEDCVTPLQALTEAQQEIGNALTDLMVGLVRYTGWM